MRTCLRFTGVAALSFWLVSCTTPTAPITVSSSQKATVARVRTTAYTHTEVGGGRNALGRKLSGGGVMSASCDWSRYPVGTHFRIAGTADEYVIDDYGGALVGTNTIDLYKPSRLEMRRWGVRYVDLEILHWGSREESLKILRPRRGIGRVRRMIASLEKKGS